MAKFKEMHDLPFILATDEDHAIAEAYGVWSHKSIFGKKFWGNSRSTFIIDPDGKIAKVFPKVSPANHSTEVLAALEELN